MDRTNALPIALMVIAIAFAVWYQLSVNSPLAERAALEAVIGANK